MMEPRRFEIGPSRWFPGEIDAVLLPYRSNAWTITREELAALRDAIDQYLADLVHAEATLTDPADSV